MKQSKLSYFNQLEETLKDISLYELMVETQLHRGLKVMMPIYRSVRGGICDRYNLKKGEFTQLYAYTRGRV